MSATLVPARGKEIPVLPRGASVVYRFNLSIPGPDPATWDTIRFSICDNDGAAYFTVPKSDMSATPGGTAGAYTLALDVPVTRARSLLALANPLAGGKRKFQLDFVTSGGYQDVAVEGFVVVYDPAVSLP